MARHAEARSVSMSQKSSELYALGGVGSGGGGYLQSLLIRFPACHHMRGNILKMSHSQVACSCLSLCS